MLSKIHAIFIRYSKYIYPQYDIHISGNITLSMRVYPIYTYLIFFGLSNFFIVRVTIVKRSPLRTPF